MALNLASAAVAETTRVHLVNALDEKQYDPDTGLPAELELYGKASKQYSQALSTLNRKRIQRKGKEQPFNVNDEDGAAFLASLTKAAHNFDLGNGPLTTVADFKALYMDKSLFFIRDAVNTALEDNSNFLAK